MQVIGVLVVLFVLVIVIVVARTISFGHKPISIQKSIPLVVDEASAAQHLAAAVRIPTISTDEGPADAVYFKSFHKLLRESYPRVHSTLSCDVVNGGSLLYTWAGRDLAMDPILLTSHLDVVPFDPGSLEQWQHAPFSGDIANGFIWGRGTIDVKNQVIAILESVEALLAQGFTPVRTIMLAFGHDEELTGEHGAGEIAKKMQQRGIHPAAVMDEGGAVTLGMLPGVKVPAAMVGIGEKGVLNLELVVETDPGHSSTPPKHTAIGILSRALDILESNPLPARLSAPGLIFQGLGSSAPLVMRLAFANLWLLGGLVKRVMDSSENTAATIRTTTALTVIQAGHKANVLPGRAQALVNCRLLPGDTTDWVVTQFKNMIADPRVTIRPLENSWDSPSVSPHSGPAFEALEQAVCETFGPIPVAPYITLAATDARHYAKLCPNVYRFSPALLNSDDLQTMHGNNERISVENLANMVRFFIRLIQKWDQLPG